MYRINDSAITSLGFKFSNFIVGTSYDFNTSTWNAATHGRGGLEMSVSYVFKTDNIKSAMLTPRF